MVDQSDNGFYKKSSNQQRSRIINYYIQSYIYQTLKPLMNQPFANKTHVFSEHINAAYIIELYSGDYSMIEETFADVVSEYPSLLANVDAAYLAGDIPALKRAVHKIKPLFGFVGLTSIQSQCLDFENSCEAHPSLPLLTNEFMLLKNNLLQMKAVIEEEKEKLVLFNSR